MTTKKALVIWGAAGHALVIADIVRRRDEYEIVGFLDDVNPDRSGAKFCGATILGGQEQLDQLLQAGVNRLIFGFGDGDARLRLSEFVRQKGFDLVTVVHPQAIIAADVIIGAGSAIVAGAVINSAVRLGENVIVNTCASIDHECVIEDGAHIGPGAHLGGKVFIGQAAWIGIGAIVNDRVIIGAGALIGAGSVVVANIPENVIAYGVPARVIRAKDDSVL